MHVQGRATRQHNDAVSVVATRQYRRDWSTCSRPLSVLLFGASPSRHTNAEQGVRNGAIVRPRSLHSPPPARVWSPSWSLRFLSRACLACWTAPQVAHEIECRSGLSCRCFPLPFCLTFFSLFPFFSFISSLITCTLCFPLLAFLHALCSGSVSDSRGLATPEAASFIPHTLSGGYYDSTMR